MDELDKKIKNVSNELFGKARERSGADCLEPNAISLYIEETADEKERGRIEEHLVKCDHCFDLVLNYKETQDETLSEVPDKWIESAKRLCSAKVAESRNGLFDIVLRFTEETIEIIRSAGTASAGYGALPAPVRGACNGAAENSIKLYRSFNDIKSMMEVERAGKGLVNIKVSAREVDSGLPAVGMRISISDPQRKIASCYAKEGEAYFEGMKYGEYVIKISRLREEAGRISLSITE